VILGCVDPVGEAGGDIARSRSSRPATPFVPGIQVNRYCASGLDAVNLAHAAVVQRPARLVVAGGVESMSRVGIGAGRQRLGGGPVVALPGYFMPQGVSADLIATKYGFSRADCDAYAVESQKRAAKAWDEGRFAKSVVPGQGRQRPHHPRPRRAHAPDTDMQGLARSTPSFTMYGEMGGFDAVAIQAHPGRRGGRARPPRRQFVGHRRRRRGGAGRLEEGPAGRPA
jgi:acetyl-CoA C-acetyltransferase